MKYFDKCDISSSDLRHMKTDLKVIKLSDKPNKSCTNASIECNKLIFV